MKRNRNIPKASIAAAVLAALLLLCGTVLAATNAPDIISEDYKSEFELDHIDVALVENGVQAKDIESQTLISHLGGKVQPGRVYKEELSARNVSDVPEIVRMIVKVYWEDENGEKDASRDPSLISLTYGDEPYNRGSWQINDKETTRERRVFYLNKILPAGKTTDPVVSRLRVDNKVLDDMEVSEEKKGNKTVYTYVYKYNGYKICVDCDVQSVQTHNPNDAVRSSWGVDNVSVKGNDVTVE